MIEMIAIVKDNRAVRAIAKIFGIDVHWSKKMYLWNILENHCYPYILKVHKTYEKMRICRTIFWKDRNSILIPISLMAYTFK